MTRISIKTGKQYFIFRAQGHAERKKGEDENLICAAISILAQTLAECVQKREKDMKAVRIRLDPGDAVISCLCDEKDSAWTSSMFEFARTGCTLLQERYPETVQIIGGEEKKLL